MISRSAIAVALLLSCASAGAQVRVSVRIDAGLMKAKYRPKVADAEKAIADELARMLPSHFSQWSYVGVSGASGPVPDFTLSFRIYEQLGAHKFELALDAPAERVKTWRRDWLGPGEHIGRGFPDYAVAPRVLAVFILDLLVSEEKDNIFPHLQKVPLTRTAQWVRAFGRREEPRLVLPLRWPGSKVLVNAMLRVECEGSKKLRSQALDTPARYDDRTAPAYDALALRPLRRISGGVEEDVRNIRDEVMRMKPIAVYLESIDPVGLQNAGEGR